MTDQKHTVTVVADHYTPVTDPDAEPVPWLYLRCDGPGCRWWLGFDQEMAPEALAAEARHHIDSEAALAALSRPTAEEQ